MSYTILQSQNAVPMAAGQVAGEKLTGKEAKKAQWLEAQQSSPELCRPQDQYKWEIDNSNTPFKGVLTHWQEFKKVFILAPIWTLSADILMEAYFLDVPFWSCFS